MEYRLPPQVFVSIRPIPQLATDWQIEADVKLQESTLIPTIASISPPQSAVFEVFSFIDDKIEDRQASPILCTCILIAGVDPTKVGNQGILYHPGMGRGPLETAITFYDSNARDLRFTRLSATYPDIKQFLKTDNYWILGNDSSSSSGDSNNSGVLSPGDCNIT